MSAYKYAVKHIHNNGRFFRQLGKLKTGTRPLYDAGWRSRQAAAREKGERGKYVGRGRFAEKGGGQQVGCAFQCSADNEKIKAVYGNYGFWSWLRYWYLDSADFVTLMLMDKGYYDYEKPKETVKAEKHERTHEQTQSLFTRMGFGKVKKLGEDKPLTPEEMQRIAMQEARERKKS